MPSFGSSAEQLVYDWDMVMLFGMKGEDFHLKGCNKRTFVTSFGGFRSIQRNGKSDLVQNQATRFLHTDRCYMDARGNMNVTLRELRKRLAQASSEELKASCASDCAKEMRAVLEREYVQFTGSDEPCPAHVFSRLIVSSIVKRLQLACGLEAVMKYSSDNSKVIVCVRADRGDLEREADRLNYRLQLKNHPFGTLDERAAAGEIDTASYYAERESATLDECRGLLNRQCDSADQPMLDPGLFKRALHPEMLAKMRQMGHDDNFSGETGVYFAPYCDFQYGEDQAHMLPLYRHKRDRNDDPSIFSSVDRIRLVTSIIGRHINTESLRSSGMMLDYFPLHDYTVLDDLRKSWVFNKSIHPFPGGHSQPIGAVRDYYGEKIGLYFAWLEHYAHALRIPAVAGVLFFIMSTSVSEKTSRGIMLIAFGGLVSLWATFYTEGWKRRNAALNLWWGTADFESSEMPRPEFVGPMRHSPITDLPEIQHDNLKALRRKMAVAFAVVFIMVVCAFFITILFLRTKIFFGRKDVLGEPMGNIAAGVLNAGWIATGNSIYRLIATKLNDWENHRTNSEWDKNLVTKTFLFRFVNSYCSFFYIAFAKAYFDGDEICMNAQEVKCTKATDENGDTSTCECNFCGTVEKPRTCMNELALQLGTIFMSQLIVGNGVEVLSPLMKYKAKMFLLKRKQGQQNTDGEQLATNPEEAVEVPELEASKEPYLEWKYAFDDYSEIVLQYGFVVLFVSAFPLVPLFALLNNALEIHVDAYKLTDVFRRAKPYQACNIGQWAVFMDLQSSLSILTNVGIIVFTSGYIGGTLASKWALFVVLEHVLMAARMAIAEGVEDVPKWVQHLSKRHDFIVQKLKGMQADEDGDELDEQAEEVDLVINENSFKFGRPVKPRQNAVPRANVQHQANTGAIVAAKPKQNQNQKSGRKLVV